MHTFNQVETSGCSSLSSTSQSAFSQWLLYPEGSQRSRSSSLALRGPEPKSPELAKSRRSSPRTDEGLGIVRLVNQQSGSQNCNGSETGEHCQSQLKILSLSTGHFGKSDQAAGKERPGCRKPGRCTMRGKQPGMHTGIAFR